MQLQNPFEMILDRLNAIQTKVGDIDTIVRSGNIPPLRKEKDIGKPSSKQKQQPVKEEGANGR